MEKSSSEIEKLADRISKDPKSKLFVPLAEEYKKAGDIERAIAVLTEGLKNNPGYITAKSFLGRLLLDKGNLAEAQKEFQEVVKSAPDNVLAQRKLGDIHVLQGRTAEALASFKAVLALNPKDAELKSLVADIDAGRDVKDKIAKPKHPYAADQSTAALPPVSPQKTPLPAAIAAVSQPAARTVPAEAVVSEAAEEPEEVLVFEQLDAETAPGAEQLPAATQDMFAELAAESAPRDEAVSTDHRGFFDIAEQGRADAGPATGSEGPEDATFDVPVATEHAVVSMDAGLPGPGIFDGESAQEAPQADWSGDAPEDLIPAFGTALEAEGESVSPDADFAGSSVVTSEAVSEQEIADHEQGIADLIPSFGTAPDAVGEPAPADTGYSDTVTFDLDAGLDENASSGAEGAIADLIPSFGTAPEPAGEPLPTDVGLTGASLFGEGPAQDGWSVDTGGSASALDASDTGDQSAASSHDGMAGSFLFDVEPIEADLLTSEVARDAHASSDRNASPADSDISPADETLSEIRVFNDSEPALPGSLISAGEHDPGALFFVSAESEVRSEELLSESDDFTTDTLAELYIAQGFYEKAIEIYERMLVDKPHSKALKDKLANVRALGAGSAEYEERGTPVLFEHQEPAVVHSKPPLPTAEPRQWQPPAEVEPREYIPPPPDENEPTVFDSGFQPVEYAPPREPSMRSAQQLEQALPAFSEDQVPSAQKTAIPAREQTIERLENWLKNIMKEK